MTAEEQGRNETWALRERLTQALRAHLRGDNDTAGNALLEVITSAQQLRYDWTGLQISLSKSAVEIEQLKALPDLIEACQFALKYLSHVHKETGDAIPGDNCRTLRNALEKAGVNL